MTKSFSPLYGLMIALIGFALLLGSSLAQSNGDSVFVVAKVPVEAQAETTAAAQNAARNKGRRQAMDILLRRLTAEDDWVYLPRLAFGQEAPSTGLFMEFGKQAVMLTPEDLPAMEEDFAVFDEKASRNSYRALITYRFKPSAVKQVLEAARLPYSESQTRKALVLPVLQTKNGVYLWESNNPWARAWLVRPLVNELTPMALPIGDSRDVQTITARQALAMNQNALSVLADRYKVSHIIIAHGYLSEKDGQYSLRVRYLNGYLDSAAQVTGNTSTANSGALYDSATGYGVSGTTHGSRKIGQVLTEAWFRGPAGDFPALARRAVTASMAKHAAEWKRKTLVDHSAITTVTVNAYFTSLAEWAKIRQTLEASPNVESIKTGALSPDGATITLVILGDIRKLVLALRQEDLVLWQNGSDRWNIAPSSLYGAIRERVENVAILPGQEGLGGDPERRRIRNPFNRQADDGAQYPDVEWRGNQPGMGDFAPPTEREMPFEEFAPEVLENGLETGSEIGQETGLGEGTILEQFPEDEQDEEETEDFGGIY